TVENAGNGRYDATFAIVVRNAGTGPLTMVQVTDRLTAFGSYTTEAMPGPGQYTVVGAPVITNALNGASLTAQPTGVFTGADANIGLLVPASSVLPQGPPNASSAELRFTVRFFPTNTGPFRNAAAAEAEGPGGIPVTGETET